MRARERMKMAIHWLRYLVCIQWHRIYMMLHNDMVYLYFVFLFGFFPLSLSVTLLRFWRHDRITKLLVIIIKQTASNFLFFFYSFIRFDSRKFRMWTQTISFVLLFLLQAILLLCSYWYFHLVWFGLVGFHCAYTKIWFHMNVRSHKSTA